MKVALSGYSGLVGSTLEKEFLDEGCEVIRIPRNKLYDFKGTELQQLLSGCDSVIHLAGSPILQQWNSKNRMEIYDSRVLTTRNISVAISALPSDLRPRSFISASAIGIYLSGQSHDEKSKQFAGHFAAQVIKGWESASENIPSDVRRVIFRMGLVLDKKSQLITQLRLPFLFGVGGPIGSGKQSFPFVHLADVTAAYRWAVSESNAEGIYNLCAPQQINNLEFSKTFAHKLHRFAWFPVPKMALKLIYGQAAQLVYESPAVIPARLLNENFKFRHPEIDSALDEIVDKKKN